MPRDQTQPRCCGLFLNAAVISIIAVSFSFAVVSPSAATRLAPVHVDFDRVSALQIFAHDMACHMNGQIWLSAILYGKLEFY
jgi:hypothetical protein